MLLCKDAKKTVCIHCPGAPLSEYSVPVWLPYKNGRALTPWRRCSGRWLDGYAELDGITSITVGVLTVLP